MRSGRTYRLLRFTSPDDRGYAEALRVYLRNIPPTLRTDSNEIGYWLQHFADDCDDRFYVFGFLIDGASVGFAEVAYFARWETFVVDYLIIDPRHRGNNTFYEFIAQLTANLEQEHPEYRYVLAEVSRMADGKSNEENEVVVRLLKMQGFKVVQAPYIQPRLGIKHAEAEMRADLLILCREDISSLRRELYLDIVRMLYFDYYDRWYSIRTGEADEYHRYLTRLYERMANAVPGDAVAVNGHRTVLQPAASTEDPMHKTLIDFTAKMLLVLVFFTAALLFLKKTFALTDTSFAAIYVLALLSLFAIMGVLSTQARNIFYRMLAFVRELIPLLQKKTKLHAKSRSPRTRRSTPSSREQRDATGSDAPKRNNNGDAR